MKKAIELLKGACEDIRNSGVVLGADRKYRHRAIEKITEAITLLQAPRWETPEQREKRTGEVYPDKAPVWSVSKYEITEKPSKYNRLRWYLGIYGEVKDNKNEIIFCAYDHLGPPSDGWRPEEE